ncbi:MAG: YitT family protein [Lachnospiraceae bacterium]
MKFLHVDKKKLVIVVIAVIMMGFANTYLNLCNFGTDPYTCMNLGISEILGWSFGNWQAFLNCAILIVVLIFARNQVGWGTLANMFLVGYSFDFFTWLNSKIIPATVFDSMVVRISVAIPALVLFVFAAAFYMAVQLGTAPYDALSFLIAEKIKKVPFKVIRIIYDLLFALGGLLLGQTVGVVTVIMAFCLGPAISWVRKHIVEKYLLTDGEEILNI